MELKNGMMCFSDKEQDIAGLAATTSEDNAPRIHGRVSEVLGAHTERLEHLSQADDDEITHAERSEIPALTEKVRALSVLSGQVAVVSLAREAELFLRSEDI